jgi:hypothetical protein
MKQHLNKQYIGFILGLIGPLMGAVAFYLMQFSDMPFIYFLENAIKAGVQTELISLCTVFNLLIFFIFIWSNLQAAARGVILATFIYVIIVLVLKFT